MVAALESFKGTSSFEKRVENALDNGDRRMDDLRNRIEKLENKLNEMQD